MLQFRDGLPYIRPKNVVSVTFQAENFFRTFRKHQKNDVKLDLREKLVPTQKPTRKFEFKFGMQGLNFSKLSLNWLFLNWLSRQLIKASHTKVIKTIIYYFHTSDYFKVLKQLAIYL